MGKSYSEQSTKNGTCNNCFFFFFKNIKVYWHPTGFGPWYASQIAWRKSPSCFALHGERDNDRKGSILNFLWQTGIFLTEKDHMTKKDKREVFPRVGWMTRMTERDHLKLIIVCTYDWMIIVLMRFLSKRSQMHIINEDNARKDLFWMNGITDGEWKLASFFER